MVTVSTDKQMFQKSDFGAISAELNMKAVHIALSDSKIVIRVRDMTTGEMHENVSPVDVFVDQVLAVAEEQRVQNLLQEQAR